MPVYFQPSFFIFPLFLLLLLAFIIQLSYHFFIFVRLAFYKKKEVDTDTLPVSIVICARNEAENLRKYLPLVLEQVYNEFQVIVVNDCSWDESGEILEQLEKQYPHLKSVTLHEQEKYRHGKKFALTLGIKAAQHELLLLIDADCMPSSQNWLANMQNAFSSRTDIVLGYGAYEKKKGLLNKFIRFDAFYNALQYLSFSLSGLTYMGVGRNLAYRKSVFFKNKGFASHQHILSGDDDLFINEVATATNTCIEINSQSFTLSAPKNNFTDWFSQKKRHISTAQYYKSKHKLLLGFLSFSHFLFYVCLISLCVLNFDWRILLSLYGFRLITQCIIVGKSMKQLKELDLIWLLPFFDLFLLFFYPTLALSNLISKPIKWK